MTFKLQAKQGDSEANNYVDDGYDDNKTGILEESYDAAVWCGKVSIASAVVTQTEPIEPSALGLIRLCLAVVQSSFHNWTLVQCRRLLN